MVTRRGFVASAASVAAGLARAAVAERHIAITMDDVNWRAIPEGLRPHANERIQGHLRKRGIRAALFPVGSNVDNGEGRAILASWNDAGHILSNHTWNHRMMGRAGAGQLRAEIIRCEALIGGYARFRRFFRFPALKEGATAELRDAHRGVLRELGYRNGYVTIDASDWYYDQRLRAKLQEDALFDAARYRQPYVAHMVDRAEYYDSLSRRVLGRSVPHTLLVHYNLLNALFLGDVLDALRERGWEFVAAEEAYRDPVFASEPQIAPAGESLIWALAKESGRFEGELRYPGEDDVYEKPKLDSLGL